MSLQMTVLHDTECLKNWAKHEHFFEMFYDIITCCNTAAQFMLEEYDVIADLIDFILGNKSPRVVSINRTDSSSPLEKPRTAMGGTVTPPF